MKRLTVAAALLLLAGCGGSSTLPSAAEQVPGLGDRLERVDTFLAAREWDKARAALRAIVAEAGAAREAGELDAVSADRVVATARQLLADLPAPVTPSATTTATSTAGSTHSGQSATQPSHDKPKPKGDAKGGKRPKGHKH